MTQAAYAVACQINKVKEKDKPRKQFTMEKCVTD